MTSRLNASRKRAAARLEILEYHADRREVTLRAFAQRRRGEVRLLGDRLPSGKIAFEFLQVCQQCRVESAQHVVRRPQRALELEQQALVLGEVLDDVALHRQHAARLHERLVAIVVRLARQLRRDGKHGR